MIVLNETKVGYAYVLLAATLWGLIGPFAKLAFQEGVTPLEVAFWRATLGAFFFGLHVLVIGKWRVKGHDVPAFVFFGLICVGLFYGAFQKAVDLGGASMAAVLLYTAPAWVALLARLFLGEQLGNLKLFALAATLLGVLGVSLGPDGIKALHNGSWNQAAIGYGLLSGLTYALYYIFGKRYLEGYSAATVMVYALPIGAIALYPWVEFQDKTATAWYALVVLAFVSTYGAFLAYSAGLRRLEATRASVVATFEPVVAAFVAYIWWDERLGPLGLTGSVLIITAVLVMVWSKSVPRRRKSC
ncbi:drug/metabolite transporter, DME family [Desulfonatronum thiosulfatophilum]|uniref:Drug/metabolite transporter, DME family n=1 Tax=Desulfonatronum thiosulfatophilum TaxID=617002 RepID=A0A1G6EXQ3_9BACT|nr:DMT family transporter [Desulfonatronum thiosulfatophilum]SDB62178.1 drug/metabolite transporter, DME family [Desulfonatronum thiosulfatophilum]